MKDYESVSLPDIDTSKFFVDPNKPNFLINLHKKDKAFRFEDNTVSNVAALRYITLMYDPSSEIRENIPYYPIRKRIAAKLAGFKILTSGKFEKNVEDMLLGGNKYVNNAIIRYCFLTMNIYFVAHAAYTDMYFRALADSYGSYEKDIRQTLDDLQKKILTHENKIMGGDEVNEMRKALYAQSKKIELNFTPEAIVRKIEAGEDLSEMSPYPKGYKPQKPKYAGHKIPG